MTIDAEYLDALMLCKQLHPELSLSERNIYAIALADLWKGNHVSVEIDRNTARPMVCDGRVVRIGGRRKGDE